MNRDGLSRTAGGHRLTCLVRPPSFILKRAKFHQSNHDERTVYHRQVDTYLFSHGTAHIISAAAGRHSVVADSADAARILPSTSVGFGHSETNGAYRTMILHNCLSGLTARLALWEEQREALTPCCRRQAQLVRWLAKFVSALLVSVTRPLLLTTSIFFDRVFNLGSAHTSSPRS